MKRLIKSSSDKQLEKQIYQFAKSDIFINNVKNLICHTNISSDKQEAEDERYDNTVSLKMDLLNNAQLLTLLQTMNEGETLSQQINSIDKPLLQNYINELMDLYSENYPQYLLSSSDNERYDYVLTFNEFCELYPHYMEDFIKNYDFEVFDYNEEDIYEILTVYSWEELLQFAQNHLQSSNMTFEGLEDKGKTIIQTYCVNMAYECYKDLDKFIQQTVQNIGYDEMYDSLSKKTVQQLLEDNLDVIAMITEDIINKINYQQLYNEAKNQLASETEEVDLEKGITHVNQLLTINDSKGDIINAQTYIDINNRDCPLTIVREVNKDFVIWGKSNSMHGESIGEYIPEIQADGTQRPANHVIKQYKSEWTGFVFAHYGNQVVVIEKNTLQGLSEKEAISILLKHQEKPITKIYSTMGHGYKCHLTRVY